MYMFTTPEKNPVSGSRRQSAEAINRAMARFPMIVRILGELGGAAVPFPGDGDIRHGCMRALTGMLAELAKIAPAAPGRMSKAEETAVSWLHCESARELIDADQLQRMQQFIDRVLGTNGLPK
jgi:hypothetical protein